MRNKSVTIGLTPLLIVAILGLEGAVGWLTSGSTSNTL
ncbi:MAG: hypothetical protein A4E62_00093 [Syntrophorhabdus sp. PtaU1.Bin002]|nr:MAG: hypothetical protein A4E58_02503 [Syntrophorhabdus sp. PtaB.Bin006]OPY74116.1 MAG: hypothetical protein A4E62_00093 [Syntrophorhabdus sp. PtaU1.Bin002]